MVKSRMNRESEGDKIYRTYRGKRFYFLEHERGICMSHLYKFRSSDAQGHWYWTVGEISNHA